MFEQLIGGENFVASNVMDGVKEFLPNVLVQSRKVQIVGKSDGKPSCQTTNDPNC
jgi:hypothetical protein